MSNYQASHRAAPGPVFNCLRQPPGAAARPCTTAVRRAHRARPFPTQGARHPVIRQTPS